MGQGQLREQAALCTGACCSGSVLQLALCLGALQSGTVSTGGQVSLPSCGDLSASIRGAGLSTVSHRRCCVIPQSFHGSAVWPSACSKCKQQQPMAAVEGLLHFSGVCMPGTAGTGLRRGGGSQQLQEADADVCESQTLPDSTSKRLLSSNRLRHASSASAVIAVDKGDFTGSSDLQRRAHSLQCPCLCAPYTHTQTKALQAVIEQLQQAAAKVQHSS